MATWFAKQGPALAYHDALVGKGTGHIILAKDISAHGHKRYVVIPRSEVDNFVGPYNELIRTNSICRLYFDLDGPATTEVRQVRDLLETVCQKLLEVYKIHVEAADAIVLCSSNDTKFSKHIIFPTVHFKNNWEHMRNFVNLIDDALVDTSVYSRNRCFRMAGCHKFGDNARIFRPGLPSSALIAVWAKHPLEFVQKSTRKPGRRSPCFPGRLPVGAFNIKRLNVPDGWKSKLAGLEPDDLLRAIHPDQNYQAFFAIGCAYKRAGGAATTFCDWCSAHRKRPGVLRQYKGWNKSAKGYGYPFLKELALYSSSETECSVHLDEAFGFHVKDFTVSHIDSTYLNYDLLSAKEKCILIKSRTGSGKSTIARALASSFSDARILYLVSSRPLAYAARDSLNISDRLHFVSYLETDKPLHKIDHLICSIQSQWRGFRLDPQAYDLIICDELSSIIEDMCNVTNKHPRENQAAFRWFSERCTRWVGLDAHLSDTSLVLCKEYFKNDIRIIINHNRGPRKDAVFIPKPCWATLDKIRSKACAPNATPKAINAFTDATCMYDLLFQCWAKEVRTFFICNNVRLGNWLEENYLRRSFTWMALLWAGLCDDIATIVTDFCCKREDGASFKKQMLKYAWIRKGDGRTGKDFKSLDWWSKIDHLQYTLKICQGIDFNPAIPHYGVGFCYTTPNTAVPRRVLQQTGRIRKFAKNTMREHPTVYFAVGERVTVKHLPVFGLKQIEEYANDQEFFMQAVVQHHSVDIKRYFDWLYEPEPVWRKLYLMCMNERETFLRYPRKSFEWWLHHDHWTVSKIQSVPKPMINWQNCDWKQRADVPYHEARTLDFMEYTWLVDRRQMTADDALAVKKYRFLETFALQEAPVETILGLWEIYCNTPSWVGNTTIERFGNLEDVIKSRFGQLWQTQKSNEWVDMAAARLVLITKLKNKLGLTELWAADKKLISPGAFRKAEIFLEKNKKQATLAFGMWYPTVKKLLHSWGGHIIKIHTRIRKRERQDVPFPLPDCSIAEFVEYMETKHLLAHFHQVHGPRLRKKDTSPYLREMRRLWRADHPSRRVDGAIRQIQSPHWHLLRHPSNFS